MESELPFSYKVVRSRRRRTASLSIDMGQVEVRVPALTDNQWVEQWLRSKVDWVVPRLQRQTQALDLHAIRIEQGAPFWFRGRPLTLSWSRSACSGVRCSDERLEVLLSRRISQSEPDAVAAQLKRWLAEQASLELTERCRALGEQTGLRPQRVAVRNYRRKWGQCTSHGLITLNWRLMHLAPEQSDYVLIHELCHLAELNHSPAFWRQVETHCPDYARHRVALQQGYPFLIW